MPKGKIAEDVIMTDLKMRSLENWIFFELGKASSRGAPETISSSPRKSIHDIDKALIHPSSSAMLFGHLSSRLCDGVSDFY
jgi:hypothetical protein